MMSLVQSSPSWKAHVDCSDGICEEALLAACLDAVVATGNDNGDDDGAAQQLLNEIMKQFHDSIIGDVCMLEFTTVASVERNPENNVRCINYHHRQQSSSWRPVLRVLKEFALEPPKLSSVLPDWVAAMSRSTLLEFCRAAERVENKEPQCQQHELDLDDTSIIQGEAQFHVFHIIGILLCLNFMGIREISCSPLPVKFVNSSSSLFKELLFGMVIDPMTMISPAGDATTTTETDDDNNVPTVLTTAIGIALLRVLTGVHQSQRCQRSPMVLTRSGSGSNAHGLKVSLYVGESESNSIICSSNPISHYSNNHHLWHSDTVTLLETNLDDMTGEYLAFIIELLLENGAVDAWVTPIVMKKGRPAHTLHCLCKEDITSSNNSSSSNEGTVRTLIELIFRHSTTLGVRIHPNIPRVKLDRTIVTVQTPYKDSKSKGYVNVKISKFINGEIISRKAEFDDCKRISIETGIPLKEVAEQAIVASGHLQGMKEGFEKS